MHVSPGSGGTWLRKAPSLSPGGLLRTTRVTNQSTQVHGSLLFRCQNDFKSWVLPSSESWDVKQHDLMKTLTCESRVFISILEETPD